MLKLQKNFWLIAPFATWMVLMTVLPSTVGGYAVRTAVVAGLLVAGWRIGLKTLGERRETCLPSRVSSPLKSFVFRLKSFLHRPLKAVSHAEASGVAKTALRLEPPVAA